MAPEMQQTRQMGGLQLLTTQKKTCARAVPRGFTLGCCSKGPDCSLWSLGASAGSCSSPKHRNAATWMPCKQLYQLCHTTKLPDTSTCLKKMIVLYISSFSAFPQSSTSSASFIPGYSCRSKLLLTAALLSVQLELYLLCWQGLAKVISKDNLTCCTRLWVVRKCGEAGRTNLCLLPVLPSLEVVI